MALKIPESMDDCLYFSNRTIGDGKAISWVSRPICEACKKGKMGKPIKKNGKVDKKADYYECPECKAQVPTEELDKKIKVSIIYTCPFCKHEGEAETEYKRRSWQGVPAYVFQCSGCNEKIGITKKMKKPKKGKLAEE